MGDSKMLAEFPDERQRAAVCYSYWGEKFDGLENACWKGYIAYGTKIVNGREVPNCVPENMEVENMENQTFAPYDWDTCIKDMTERYGENAAPRICGKIRSENMSFLGLVDGVPYFPTREEAEIISEEIGCEGSHEMGEYGYSPCNTHEEAKNLYNASNLLYLIQQIIKESETE
jgi:hypothetical protein